MHPRVMVVEDERALSDLLKYNLEAEGFRVQRAENGELAFITMCQGGALGIATVLQRL